MKKFMSVLLSVALITAMLAGCGLSLSDNGGSSSGGDGGKTQLTFWAGLTGDDQQAMADMVDTFNSEQDEIEVEFYSVTWGEIFTRFSAASNTENGPDVMLMHPTDLPSYAARDMITPLDDLAESVGISGDDYSDVIWQGNQVDGQQYGIPLDYHCMSLFLNMDAFEAAGLTADDARVTSVEEFNDLCEKLTTDDQFAVGLGSNYAHTYRYWYGLLSQAGGNFLNDDMTEAAFNSAEGEEALDFLASWVKNGYAPEAEADIDADWLGGTIAMVIEGPWFVPTAMESGMNFATVEFPQVLGENAVWGSSHTITVPRYDDRSEEKTAATETFIKWLVDNSFNWSAQSGQIPANSQIRESEDYKNLDLYPYAEAFMNQADYVVYEPLCPGTSEFGADNELSPVANAVYSVISGESDSKTALSDAATSVDNILQQ